MVKLINNKEEKILTILNKDVPKNRFNYKTKSKGFRWYNVIYYDNFFKIKCSFNVKVLSGNNTLSIIRLNIAIRHISENYTDLIPPDIYNSQEASDYVKKCKFKFNLDKNLNLPSTVERIVSPNFLNSLCEFDFYETSSCKGCRENKLGLSYHKDGCF